MTPLEEVKRYNIIYADPPWPYKVWSGKGKTAANYYDLMTVEEICSLPIQNIAADDCILFLWVIPPCLPSAFKVIEAWGFTYKTKAFNWVKRNKKSPSWFWGLGYWTRANTEDCLLATKGRPKRVSRSVHQVVDTPIEQHSKKPDEVRERIVQLCGDLPRIELFARQKTPGWDVWGNEVESDIALIPK